MKIKLPRTNDMNWQQRMELYEALKFACISKGFSNFMWVTDAVIDAFNEAELDIPYSAAVPRLSEQDVVTDKTPDTERKDGSAYQAGRKQDAPTVEANPEYVYLTGDAPTKLSDAFGILERVQERLRADRHESYEAVFKVRAIFEKHLAALKNAAE